MRACFLLYILLFTKHILTCDYVPPSEDNVSIAKTEYPVSYRSAGRNQTWDWIRIQIHYDSSIERLSEEKRGLLMSIVVSAKDYFETTVKVQRLRSLQLIPRCRNQSHGEIYPGGIICKTSCEKRCGDVIAPPDAAYFLPCECEYGPCPTQEEWGGKLMGVDFLLFVSVKEDNCRKSLRAYASHCSLDEWTYRPIAGFVNFCPYKIERINAYKAADWLSTLKHEMLHVLVFSPALFPLYGGIPRIVPPDQFVIPGVVELFDRFDWETSSGPWLHDVYMMVTPKVREEARRHFNCSDLEGAELESQGGSGAAFAHWDERAFQDEIMSTVGAKVDVVSRLTLAAMEDSGWYHVDYDKAEEIKWGRGLGCDFAKKSCLTWMKTHRKDPFPYCTIYKDSRCSADRTAKLHCNLEEVLKSDIPPEFNYNIENLYFDENGERIYGAGAVETADFCPFYSVFDNSRFENSAYDSRCTLLRNAIYRGYSLEVFSRTSRCIEVHSVNIELPTKSSHYPAKIGCYETLCQDSVLQIRALNSEWYPCNYKGKIVRIEQPFYGRGKLHLRLVCPSCSEICDWEFCAPNISSTNYTVTTSITRPAETSTTNLSETSITRPSETSFSRPLETSISRPPETTMTRSSEAYRISTRYSSTSAPPSLSSRNTPKMYTISPPHRSSETPFNMFSTTPSDITSSSNLFDNTSPVPHAFSKDSSSKGRSDKARNSVVIGISLTLVALVCSVILYLLYKWFYG